MSHQHLQLTDELVDYIRQVSPAEPPFLARLREETSKHARARMQITPEQGRFLQLLVQLLGARRILEIGVFTGYSSTAMALALPPHGHLIACDVSEEFTSIARRYWAEAGVESRIDLRLAPALDTLAAIRDAAHDQTFDLVFIDADKESYLAYYLQCLSLLRPGGLIAVDNTLWHGDVARPEVNDAETRAIRDFNEYVQRDARVYSCLLPIGDGLTLALKL
jgi:caffeoyl-CoA O-methyltransferase